MKRDVGMVIPSDFRFDGEIDGLYRVVDKFAEAMKKRLCEKILWTGWCDSKFACSPVLIKRIKRNLEKGDMIDIANLAAFVWNWNESEREVKARQPKEVRRVDNDPRLCR